MEKKQQELANTIRDLTTSNEKNLTNAIGTMNQDAQERNLNLLCDIRTMTTLLLQQKNEPHKHNQVAALVQEMKLMAENHAELNTKLQAKISKLQTKAFHSRSTHFVDSNAPTPLHGKTVASYVTISQALEAASAGDVIIVKDGIYNESLVIDKPIMIIGTSAPDRVVVGSSDAHTIRIVNTSSDSTPMHVTIAHLSIVQMSRDKQKDGLENQELIGFVKTDKQQKSLQTLHTVQLNCALQVTGKGVWATLDNCLLSGGLGSCVHVSHLARLDLKGSRVYESKGDGITIDNNLPEELLKSDEDAFTEVNVEDNDVYSNAGHGIVVTGPIGCSAVLVRNNRIRENERSGIYVEYSRTDSECLIESNTICKNWENNIHVHGDETKVVIISNNIHDAQLQHGILVSGGAEIHCENCELMRNKQSNIFLEENVSVENSVIMKNLQDSDLNELL